MLITKTMVETAMCLHPLHIINAFDRNGYHGEIILTAQFKGMTPNGSFAYWVTFGGDGNCEPAMCYVCFNEAGEFLADY